MMKRIVVRLAVTMVVLVGSTRLPLAAGDDKSDAVKKELEKFQGKWAITSHEEAGKKANTTTWGHSVEGDKMTATAGKMGQVVVGIRTIKIDPTKSPAEIDISYDTGRNKGWKVKGIYKFDGDTLTIHHGMDGKERPTNFEVKPGTDTVLWVEKKVKP